MVSRFYHSYRGGIRGSQGPIFTEGKKALQESGSTENGCCLPSTPMSSLSHSATMLCRLCGIDSIPSYGHGPQLAEASQTLVSLVDTMIDSVQSEQSEGLWQTKWAR